MKYGKTIFVLLLVLSLLTLPVVASRANSSQSDASVQFVAGEIAFDNAPSIHFGTHQIKGKTADYQAERIEGQGLVDDARGGHSGWIVTASLSNFQGSNGSHVLRGAEILLKPGAVSSPNGSMSSPPRGAQEQIKLITGSNSNTPVWVASSDEGRGTWALNLDKNQVLLRIPGGRGITDAYTGTLHWSLVDAP